MMIVQYAIILVLAIGLIAFNYWYGVNVHTRVEEWFFETYLPQRLGARTLKKSSWRTHLWIIHPEDREKVSKIVPGLLSVLNYIVPLVAALPIFVAIATMVGVVWLLSKLF